MAKWKYEGESFDLPDNLSAEQATSQIEAILENRRIKERIGEGTPSGQGAPDTAFTDESVLPKPSAPSIEEEGFLGQAFEGIMSGATRIVQGPLELAGMYSDLKYVSDPVFQAAMREKVKKGEAIPASSNTPMTDLVIDSFDAVREKLDFTPTTTTGKITEALTQFAGPGYLAAKTVEGTTRLGRYAAVNLLRKGKRNLSKRQRLTLAGQQIAAAAATDFVVASDDTEGLHDFFELGPDRSPEKVVGETALESTAMRLLDRSLIGAEAGLGQALLPPLLGAAFKTVAKVGASRPIETVSDVLARNGYQLPIASSLPRSFTERARQTTVADLLSLGALPAARAGIEATTNAILKQEARILDPTTAQDLSAFDNILGGMFANLRYRGYLDPAAARINSLVNAAVEGDVKVAETRLRNVEKQIDKYLTSPAMQEQSDVTKQTLLNAFMDVLETGQRPTDLPDELFASFKSARSVIDKLSEKLIDSGAVRNLPETAAPGKMSRSQLMQVIRDNIESGGYLRKRYAAYENPDYKIEAGTDREREIFDLIRGSRGGRYDSTVFNHMKETLSGGEDVFKITPEQTVDTLTERQMREYIRLVLSKTPAGRKIASEPVGRTAIRRLNPQLLNRRKVDSPVLKEILGQTKNPTEAYIATVSDLSTFIANDSFYTRLRQIANNDIADATFRRGKYGERFASTAEREQLAELRRTNPAATLADLGPKRRGRYINIVDETARRKEEVQLQLDQAVAEGASEGRIRQLAQQLDMVEDTLLKELKSDGYHIIGRMDGAKNIRSTDPGAAESAFGEMHNIAVPDAMWRSLSRRAATKSEGLNEVLRQTYGAMMKLKGITQFNKTILSPITQVRNVTSASLFALAQGNVGSGANIFESVQLVLRDLANKTDEEGLAYLTDMQRRGLLGSSAYLREIQDNLRKGTDPRNMNVMEDAALVSDVATTGDRGYRLRLGPLDLSGSLDRNNRRNKGWQFLGKAADPYRAGDDVWKIYNYEFEASKLREAYTNIIDNIRQNRGAMTDEQYKFRIDAATNRFKKFIDGEEAGSIEEAIKNRAAENVRNLVPNYELVPQVIKDIRGLPVGNFIAFPAEILRTGFNTLETAAKELTSDDKAIREIGMRRLMGSLSTFYVAGPALRDMSMKLAGVSEEEMEAARTLAADYQKNSTLIALGRDQDGLLELMDYSRFNPYDALIRPFETLLNSLDEQDKLNPDAGFGEKAINAMWESVYGEFLDPFLSESISFAALRDVAPKAVFGRGGETQTGARVYREAETRMKKLERALIHVINQTGPMNLTPVRVPTGADLNELELSRLPRSLFNRVESFGVQEREPSTGRTYAPKGEIFRQLVGLQTFKVDPDRIGKFKANEFKALRSEAATLFNDMANMDFADEDDYVRGYLAANQARLKVFRKFAKDVQALRDLGMSKREVETLLKKEKLGREEIKSLLRGEYLPFTPSKEKIKEARKKGHNIPMGTLRVLEAELKRLSIDPDYPEAAPEGAFTDPEDRASMSAPAPAPVLPSLAGEALRNVTLPSLMPSPQQAPAPGPTTKVPGQAVGTPVGFTYKGQQIPAELLGGNPEDIMKNVEIYRRSQQ